MLCAFGHPVLFATGKLYDERRQVAAFDAAQNVTARFGQLLARDHLRDDERRSETMGKAAEWQIAYSGHGRQHCGRRAVYDIFQHVALNE